MQDVLRGHIRSFSEFTEVEENKHLARAAEPVLVQAAAAHRLLARCGSTERESAFLLMSGKRE